MIVESYTEVLIGIVKVLASDKQGSVILPSEWKGDKE